MRWLIIFPLMMLMSHPLCGADKSPLEQKQQEARQALSDLREILHKVAAQAAKEDPELEKKLLAACAVIDECDLDGDMNELAALIADMNFMNALIKGGDVQEGLERLISCLYGAKIPSDRQIDDGKSLLDKVNDLLRRQEEIDRNITKENVADKNAGKLAEEQGKAANDAQDAANDAKKSDFGEIAEDLAEVAAEMQAVEKAINGSRPTAAQYHSKTALQKLRRLRDTLVNELPMMALMRIEAWLQEMIQTQTGVLEGTIDCEQRVCKAGVVSRTLRGVVSALQQDQLRVAALADEVIERLRKEGNVLTCEILEEIKTDANEVAGLLSREDFKHPDLGVYCQFVQHRILEDLKLLVEMVLEELERRRLPDPKELGAEDPYRPDGKPRAPQPGPLLDPVAEFVLLRLLQQNVIIQWDALQRELSTKPAADEIDTLIKDNLASKQSHLRNIVAKLQKSGVLPVR